MSLTRFRQIAGAARATIGMLGAAILAGLFANAASGAAPANPVRFAGSIRQVESVVATGSAHAHVVRTQLAASELAADLRFEVALRMRNFDELQARLAKGETVPAAEMTARFFPTTDDYNRVIAWLKQQGFAITRTDDNHLAVFARGSVDRVRGALQVDFARVLSAGRE